MSCLDKAKEAYANQIDPEDIDNAYQELERQYRALETKKSNTIRDLNKFAEELSFSNEQDIKESLLRQLNTQQAVVDSLQREQLFRKAGHKSQNSVFRSALSKLAGTSWKADRNKDNTYNRQGQAIDGFYREFATDIKGPLTALFTSKTGQTHLANALYDLHAGREPIQPYGQLATIVMKYQDRLFEKLKPLGIFITEREDRIAPNVHDADKILKLNANERKKARELYEESGNPEYEYAFHRWNEYILTRIDPEKVFEARNVDMNNIYAVEEFQRHAFDNLVNRGKVSQQYVNFANKFKESRVYHWKDGKSLVEYNNRFGNESLQDSILRELSNGFGMVEVINDWGSSPQRTLDLYLKAVDVNESTVQRTNKAKESQKLHNIMQSMTSREYIQPNALNTLTTNLLTYEAISKLGLALASSITDLRNTAYAAKALGKNRFQSYGGVLKNMTIGMSKKQREDLARYVNVGISSKLGQVGRFYTNPYSPSSWQGQGMHWISKLNLLNRWEDANKGYIASVVAQHLADNRHTEWSKLTSHDQEVFSQYNINEHDWNAIRQSSARVGESGEFIMPDSVQEIPDDIIKESLRRQDVENAGPVRIKLYKDSLERKLATFFRDRQEYSITNPDVVDKNLPFFNAKPESTVVYSAMRVGLQFKHFGASWIRKTVLPVLREKGATNATEMFFSGKANWKGIGVLGVELMALSYVGLSLRNLAQGLTPPSLEKEETWAKLVEGTLGPLSMAFNINLKDLRGTAGSIVEGPVGTDIEKAARLVSNAYKERGKSRQPRTRKSAYQLVKNGIPFNAIMTKNLVNHLFLNEFEDWAYPGKRQKDLRKIQQDTGATQLW